MNIRIDALPWFRQKFMDPNQKITQMLIKEDQYNLGWDTYKHYLASSKYYPAKQAFPKIPVWWLRIDLLKVAIDNPSKYYILICQKRVNDISDFWLLAVPIEYLRSQYDAGNLDVIRNSKNGQEFIYLHLSTEKRVYKGYDVNMFDDIRMTWRFGKPPVPFGQFYIEDC